MIALREANSAFGRRSVVNWLKPAGLYLIIVGMILFLRSGLKIRERNFVQLSIAQMVIRSHAPLMIVFCALLFFGLFSGMVYWGFGCLVPLIALGCFFPGLRREYRDRLAMWRSCRDEIERSDSLPLSVADFLNHLEEESRERNLDSAALYLLLSRQE